VPRAVIKEFVFPSQVINYAGSSGQSARCCTHKAFRPGPVGVVADRVVHESGLTDALLKGFADVGYEPHVFAEIAGEPDLEVVQKATAVAAAARAVAFVGRGGGSAILPIHVREWVTRPDARTVIASGLCRPEPHGKPRRARDPIPIGITMTSA
jgi:hypothetical protein